MSQDSLALTPEGLQALNRWHLIIGLILLLLLFLLPLLFGIGPSTWKQCAAASAVSQTPAPMAAPVAPPAAEAAKPAPSAPPKAVVFFDTGKAGIGDKGLADLKALAAMAGPSSRLAVSGYHDARGDPARNAELAKERALAVREALKAAGVAEARIELRKPEATSAASSGVESEAAARRVEVSVLP
ncbi:MAG: OmpA family protein [Rubrivivax sp.]|nr:OmpA family protein [Rubrivivax sp.]